MKFKQNFSKGFQDFIHAIISWRVFYVLGLQDIRIRYIRSKIGLAWLTFNTLITMITLGFVFGYLMGDGFFVFFPYLVLGFLFWSFIETVLNELTVAFPSSAGLILETKIPFYTHIFRVLYRNLIIFGHNLILIPILIIFFDLKFSFTIFSLILLLFETLIFIIAIGGVLAIISCRYRDMSTLLSNIVRILFYLTPILWNVDMVKNENILFFIKLNPFYSLINQFRNIFINGTFDFFQFFSFTTISLLLLLLSFVFFGNYKNRIAYWL